MKRPEAPQNVPEHPETSKSIRSSSILEHPKVPRKISTLFKAAAASKDIPEHPEAYWNIQEHPEAS